MLAPPSAANYDHESQFPREPPPSAANYDHESQFPHVRAALERDSGTKRDGNPSATFVPLWSVIPARTHGRGFPVVSASLGEACGRPSAMWRCGRASHPRARGMFRVSSFLRIRVQQRKPYHITTTPERPLACRAAVPARPQPLLLLLWGWDGMG